MNRNLAKADARRSGALAALLALLLLAGGAALIMGTGPADSPVQAGALAYGSEGDIFVAESDGANPVRIADGDPFGGAGEAACGSFSPDGPMWSPDGRLLAFGAERDTCGWEVWIADPNGVVITTIPDTRPTWSPDGRSVATASASTPEIGIYGVDGVRQALLAVPPGVPAVDAGGSGDLAWTRDGTSILVRGPIETWELPIDGQNSETGPLSSVDLRDLESTLLVTNAAWGDWRPTLAGS